MVKQLINVGTAPDDGTGDTLRIAFTKSNENFNELYSEVENIIVDASELTDTQNVLFDGNYDSLDNLPTIPSDISVLTDTSDLLIIKDHIELTNRLQSVANTLVSFTKPPNTSSNTVFDEIDTNLILTRDATGIGGLGGGIYNKSLEDDWEATESPLGTEWNLDGWDNLDDVKLRFYEPLREVFRNRIGENIVGAKLVMHDTTNDKYYKFEFSQWQQGADHDGSFAYTRELIDTTNTVGITYADGSVQVSAPRGFTGFEEIFLGNTSDYDIQPKDAGKYLQAFNTTIYIPDDGTLGFKNGDYVVIVARNGPVTIEPRNAAVIYNPEGNTNVWTIPARTTAFLIRTDNNTWNLTGKLLTFTGSIFGANNTLLVDSANSKIVGPVEYVADNVTDWSGNSAPESTVDAIDRLVAAIKLLNGTGA